MGIEGMDGIFLPFHGHCKPRMGRLGQISQFSAPFKDERVAVTFECR